MPDPSQPEPRVSPEAKLIWSGRGRWSGSAGQREIKRLRDAATPQTMSPHAPAHKRTARRAGRKRRQRSQRLRGDVDRAAEGQRRAAIDDIASGRGDARPRRRPPAGERLIGRLRIGVIGPKQIAIPHPREGRGPAAIPTTCLVRSERTSSAKVTAPTGPHASAAARMACHRPFPPGPQAAEAGGGVPSPQGPCRYIQSARPSASLSL
jgi:hypothetical protein